MAKKKASPPPQRSSLIKVSLTKSEHDLVRVAAACKGKNMAEYARDVVLRAAKAVDSKDVERLAVQVDLPE